MPPAPCPTKSASLRIRTPRHDCGPAKARIFFFRGNFSRARMHYSFRKRKTSESSLPYRGRDRSEEHTSELQSPCNLVCRLLLEKKKKQPQSMRVSRARSIDRAYM